MATLTKSRARKPLANGPLIVGCSKMRDGKFIKLMVNVDAGTIKATYYTLTLPELEAESLAKRIQTFLSE